MSNVSTPFDEGNVVGTHYRASRDGTSPSRENTHMKHSVLARLALVAGAVAIMGCGDDDDPVTPGALNVAVSPSEVTLQAGTTGDIVANVGRSGSFTGPITLTSTGAPAGVTIAFTNATIPANTTTTAGTVTLLGTTTPGTYPIIVTAAGTGVTSRADTMSLTVTAPVTP